MIPEGWKTLQLDELALVQRGKFSARPRNDPQFYGGNIPFVQTGDVSLSGKFLCGHSQTLNEKGLEVSKLFPENTILITIAANIGDCAIAQYDVAFPDSVVGIQVRHDQSHEWLFYSLSNQKEYLDKRSTQNAQKNINLEVLRPLKILTPPLCEQRRIAEILSTWDRAIEVTKKLIANSEAQKKALMQKLLTGKERLPGFEGEWGVSKFSDVFEIFIGGTPSRKNEEYWDNDKLTENYWVAISDLKEKYLSDTKERITQSGVENSNVKLLQSNTVVFSFKLSIGKKSILQKPAYTNEAICALLPKSNSEINHLFVYHMLGHMDLEGSVDQAVKGKTLNKAKIASLDLRHPKIKEQMEIVQILEAADDELIALNNCLASITAEKSALMQQLLTGKRRVKIDKEAAA